MPANPVGEVIQHLRRVLQRQEAADVPDGHLLGRFLDHKNEAAIQELVRRHGPMVWGVCRRVLRNYHDAEDAFQATFLVLVRRAASIASRELLANWLYGVAHQTALKARATAAKRKERERQVTEMPEPAVTQQDPWRDLQPVLDEELSRLPDKYRSVIVLCDLEGKTRKEAAGQLGCPEGTVASRLVRARTMLAKRLPQRGVALSGGAFAAVIAQQAASAGMPNSVMVSTIKAASIVAAGKAAAAGAISVKVAALTEGVMKAMLFTKLKAAIAVVLALGFVATGATILTCRTAAGQDDKKPTTEAQSDKPPSVDKPPIVKDKSIPLSDDLRGQWKGAKNGIEVHITFRGEKAHWQVEFVKTRKPKEPYEATHVRIGIAADLKCVPDVEAGRWNLYLPLYLGNDKEFKEKYPVWAGRTPVGEITRGAEGAIQLRIIPTGRDEHLDHLDHEDYDYPAVEGFILHRDGKTNPR